LYSLARWIRVSKSRPNIELVDSLWT
jgi:hypothetical protein